MPRLAILVDTAFAVLLIVAGAYHFAQPYGAWRSAVAEMFCAAALLALVRFGNRTAAIVVHVVLSVIVFGLGMRHFWFFGREGWRSGTVQGMMGLVLLGLAIFILMNPPAHDGHPRTERRAGR